MSDLASVLAGNVKRLRVLSGRSQTWLAERCDVSQSCLSAIEQGANDPSVVTAARIAEALGTTIDALLAEPDCCPTCGQVLPPEVDQ